MLRKIFTVIIVGVSFFGVGYYFGVKGFAADLEKYPIVNITRATPADKTTLDFSLFWRVWDTMHTKYYDQTKVKDSDLVYGAIRGMVAGVGDPYTVFLEPTDNKLVEEDLHGSFEGVGIQIGFKGSQLAVIAPLPESPAEKAGVRAGDLILAIKDESKKIEKGTVGMTLEEAVKIIRGPANSTVTLTLLRDDAEEPMTVDIKRQSIDVPSLVVKYMEDKKEFVHIKLTKFAGETNGEWDQEVTELVKNGELKGIIFDVRNNPGGYLNGAVELASEFLETGSVIVREEDYSGLKDEAKVERIGRLKDIKMVVLMNEGSASASEIFAGAIKDNKRGILIGEKSFGKGTIQEPEQLDGGAGLHITIAKWLTPSGTWVHEDGLTPDVEVKDDENTTDKDEQLERALEEIKKL